MVEDACGLARAHAPVPEQDRTGLFFSRVPVFWGQMAMASVGQLRILERRLARLAAEADRMAGRIEQREEVLRAMERVGREMDALANLSPQPEGTGRRASELQERIEKIRAEAERARACVADWIDRARQLVLDGARLEPRLLPVAEKTQDLRLWWQRGPEQMQLIVLRARQALTEALQLLQPPVAGMPDAPAAPAEGRHGEELLTVRDAAKLLTISAKKLYRMAALGRVPHVRLGRSVRFRQEDLERWIQQQTVHPLRR